MSFFKSRPFVRENFRQSQNWELAKYGVLGDEYFAVNEQNFNAGVVSSNACIIFQQGHSTLFCDIQGNVKGLMKAASIDKQLRSKPVSYFIINNAQLKKSLRLKFKFETLIYPISSLTKRFFLQAQYLLGLIKKKSSSSNLKINHHTVWTSARLTS